MPAKIPTKELLINLQNVAADLDKTPTIPEYREHELSEFGPRTYATRFGGWNEALKTANLKPNKRQSIPTDELLTNLLDVAADLGKTPAISEYREHELSEFGSKTYATRFGGWNEALKAADLKPNKRQSIPTDELLINLRDVAADLGKSPTKSEYREHELSEFGPRTYETRFGRWNEVLRAADLELNKRQNIPTDELLTNLRDVAADLDKAPSRSEYREHELSGFDPTTYDNRFENWNEALRAADLEPNQRRNIPINELLTNLRNVATDLDKTPTKSEYREHTLGEFGPTTFETRFSGWNEALRAADLEPNQRQDIPTDELLTNLRDVATDLDKTPTKSEYREHTLGEFGPTTFETRFSGWNEALRAADLEPKNRHSIPTDELLSNLRDVAADLGRAPTKREYREHRQAEFDPVTFEKRLNGWWESVVTAGYQPVNQRPLRPDILNRYFETAADLPPKKALPPLLFLFTGLPASTAQHFTPEWLQEKRDRNIIRIPSEHTTTGEPWLFRIPDEWQNPYTDEMQPTHLPQVLNWVFNNYGEIPLDNQGLINQCLRVAQAANIGNSRECKAHSELGDVPIVRPSDIWVTHGVNLARRSIDRSIIKRRLGINQIKRKSRRTPDNFMLWLYVHEGFKHPDFEPPGVVFDPI